MLNFEKISNFVKQAADYGRNGKLSIDFEQNMINFTMYVARSPLGLTTDDCPRIDSDVRKQMKDLLDMIDQMLSAKKIKTTPKINDKMFLRGDGDKVVWKLSGSIHASGKNVDLSSPEIEKDVREVEKHLGYVLF